MISIYQKFFSKILETFFVGGCRFRPTCSDYAKDAFKLHGSVRGTLLSVRRLARCHPFTPVSYDPVPHE